MRHRALAVPVLLALHFTALADPPQQDPLDPLVIPKYVEPLPSFVGARIGGPLVGVTMRETAQQVLPASFYATLPAPYSAGTTVWAYEVKGLDVVTGKPVARGPLYPGVTVEARRFIPTHVLYTNELRSPTLQRLLPFDQTLPWADPLGLGCQFQATPSMECLKTYEGPVPIVVHLHGGEVPPAFDGGPDQWFTVDGRRGPNYASLTPVAPNQALYRYPNTQEAGTIWFHDHALGITRLNVHGGVAAFYFLRDGQDTGRADNPLRLPAGDQEREIVFQDRAFDVNGQLRYHDPTQIPNPDLHPWWRPEFFGDVIVVNGKSWPRFDAEPRRYRLRLLNGSNARVYRISLRNADGTAGPPFWQIGTDGGRLDAPVRMDTLLLGGGERFDVILDLTNHAGATFTVVNDAPAPFPDGDPVDPDTTGQLLQIKVAATAKSADGSCDPSIPAAAGGCRLRPGAPLVRLVDPAGTLAPGVKVNERRQLVLREVLTPNGPRMVTVNNTPYDGLKESTKRSTPQPVADAIGVGEVFVNEAPRVGSTEIWEIANLTVDGHPMHVHLVQVQLLNRQQLNTGFDPVTDAPFGYVKDWFDALPKNPADPASPLADGPPKPYLTRNGDGALGGNLAFGTYLGAVSPPQPNEAGWKDTVLTYPGTVTRVAIRFAPTQIPLALARPGWNLYPFDATLTDPNRRDLLGNPGAAGYVWHCHIVDHEDNDMMRPYVLVR